LPVSVILSREICAFSQVGVPTSAGAAAALPLASVGLPPTHHGEFACGSEGDEFAFTDDVDRLRAAFRTALSSSATRCAPRAGVGAARGRATHILGSDVVNEAATRHLGGQVEPRQMLADDLVGRGPLDRRCAGGAASGGISPRSTSSRARCPSPRRNLPSSIEFAAQTAQRLGRRSRTSAPRQTGRMEAPPTAIE
jgi:hypothetical protein